MTFDLQDTHQEYTDHGNFYEGESEQVTGLRLNLKCLDKHIIQLLG